MAIDLLGEDGMKTIGLYWQALFLIVLLVPLQSQADAPSFRISDATPVGSWVEREHTTVDHKNKTTVSILRQKMLEKVRIEGKDYVWIETESTNYKVSKKDKRKQQGETAVVKALVEKDALDGDPANLANNLTGFGKEIIFQTGKGQPMRMREGGTMAGMVMSSLGIKVDYQFASAGSDKVTTPAGEFKAEKFTGTGSVETRILIKKISVQSESEFWMTPELPFGFAKMVSRDTVNGKLQTTEGHVTAFGRSGATSAIVGEPSDFMGGEGGFNFKDLVPGGGS